MKVLLVDDDYNLIDVLRYVFQRDGHTVVAAFDGAAGIRMFQTESPDLVILDLIMPGQNGMEVLREIRRRGDIPVIVLTALSDEDHVVTALQIGADDYLVKPFRPRELSARVQALRRRSRPQAETAPPSSLVLALDGVRLDPGTREVAVDGRPVTLTRTEFGLLHYLMLNHDLVVRVPDILASVWGYEAEENDEVVKVTISRLRRKVEVDPARPRRILNVPGVGYKFQGKSLKDS